jgi:hypothetical protein
MTTTRAMERRHGGQPLSAAAYDIDVIALHLHDARCDGHGCVGPDDTDHLRANVLLEALFDYGYEPHRFGVDCTVRGT